MSQALFYRFMHVNSLNHTEKSKAQNMKRDNFVMVLLEYLHIAVLETKLPLEFFLHVNQ